MASKIISLFFVLLVTACGGGDPEPATAPQVADGPVHVATAYGDSTQEAQGQPHAASRPSAAIINEGIGGTAAWQLLHGDGVHPVWAQQLARDRSSVVIINHGINDYDRTGSYPTANYKIVLRTLVDQAVAAGKTVLLEEPNPVGETPTPLMNALQFDVAAFEARRLAMREVATEAGVAFCAQPRVALADGIHPTPEGYAEKANRLAACIADLI